MQGLAALKTLVQRIVSGAKQASATVEAAAITAEQQEAAQATQSGFFGGAAALEDYYFPAELTGGVCPRIVGQERDIAWHAAAEACDTERVHLIWQATPDKVWYLAARSSDFASHAHTWCPFTSLLPGMPDAQPTPVCYTYYSDEAAVMMTVTADTLQIHRGTTAVVRAKAERMVRDLSGAREVPLDPSVIIGLKPVAWQSIALFEDRVRRVLVALVVASGLVLAVLAFCVWLFAALGIMNQNRQLTDIQERTAQKTLALMDTVEQSRVSTLRAQVARFADLNEGLVEVGGWMKFYQIRSGAVRWRALVPPSVTGDKIKEFGAKLLVTNERGIIIGTDNDPAVKR
jgi:hypothetical protein